MKNLLLIHASIFNENSTSSFLAREFTKKLSFQSPLNITELDLAAAKLPHLDGSEMSAWMTPVGTRTEQQVQLAKLSDNLIEQLQSSDIIVIGMPMYNFGIPSTFKTWIDRIARAGATFKYTEHGPVGLLNNKKVYIMAARGGMYVGTPKDTQTTYLRDVFSFVGINDVQFVYAEALNMGQKDTSTAKALAEIDNLLDQIAEMHPILG